MRVYNKAEGSKIEKVRFLIVLELEENEAGQLYELLQNVNLTTDELDLFNQNLKDDLFSQLD